jgi:hypothetical protein
MEKDKDEPKFKMVSARISEDDKGDVLFAVTTEGIHSQKLFDDLESTLRFLAINAVQDGITAMRNDILMAFLIGLSESVGVLTDIVDEIIEDDDDEEAVH